ncbi:MAG: PQQ-like beta-propeller repeat protein [Candidatus Omnitrophica bacterium]|nr:PQQ-like beta-propeller repeat protein [Candidatus Omnitrophota bacterium]
MKPHFPPLALFLVLCFSADFSASQSSDEYENYWPQWRGPSGNGEAPSGAPPMDWSEETNVLWKKPIGGYGHATPIVWGDQVFLLTAVKSEANEPSESSNSGRGLGEPAPDSPVDYKVLAFDRHTGDLVWEKVAAHEVPHEGTHRTGSFASASPVTDGELLFAFFGSRGIFAYDLEGNLKWSKDLGDMTIKRGFGEGSSPALHGNSLVINWDHEGDSFIIVLDKRTGEEKWRRPRDEKTSWSTPRVVDVNGRPQVVVNATNRVRSYDLETGEVIWECTGMTDNVIPTPVAVKDRIYLTSGFRGSLMVAVNLSTAKGDVTGSDSVDWEISRDTPYVPSPLLYDGKLYYHKRNDNILYSVDAETGEVVYGPERLDDIRDVYASPVAADGKVYLTGRNGVFYVVSAGAPFQVLAKNQLDDEFSASPAIVGDDLYLRGRNHLYCISDK